MLRNEQHGFGLLVTNGIEELTETATLACLAISMGDFPEEHHLVSEVAEKLIAEGDDGIRSCTLLPIGGALGKGVDDSFINSLQSPIMALDQYVALMHIAYVRALNRLVDPASRLLKTTDKRANVSTLHALPAILQGL